MNFAHIGQRIQVGSPLGSSTDFVAERENQSWDEGVPTVLRSGPYRFFFYAGDRDELPHVHVERNDRIAKFWLDPVRLQRSGGFPRQEMSLIQKLLNTQHAKLLEAWNEYVRG